MNGHKMNSQYFVHIHPGRASNIQIGNNKTMYINSRGECSTSPPPPSAASETRAEDMQRLEENSRKRREEATKKRMEEKQKRQEEPMRESHPFKDFRNPIHFLHRMMNRRRGTENVDTGRDPVDADQETIEDTDAKKRREERQKIRDEVERGSHPLGDLDLSRIDYLRMMDERRGIKNMDTDRDPVETERETVYTDAKKRREERRDEVKRESHPLRDLVMSRFDYHRMMEERRGMKNVDTCRDPVNNEGGPVETDRATDEKKRQKIRDKVKQESRPLRDLDMLRINYLRMMKERRGIKNVDTDRDPVNNDGRPVETDRDTDEKKRMEERQKRREEDMRGSHPFEDFDYLHMFRNERRGRATHADSHGEDMRNTNMKDDSATNIIPDIRNIGEKGTNGNGENMDTEMENVDTDRNPVSSKGVCPVKTDRGTVDTDRDNVDTQCANVDTGRDTVEKDRDSVDTGRDTVDADRDTVDTDPDTVDTDRDSVDTDRDNVGTIKENQEDKQSTVGSVVSDVENDDETNREDAEKKNINLEGKYNGVNEDDHKYDRGNKHVNTFTMTNNCFDDNDYMHTCITSINNFSRCSNIQIGNQNKMIFSSTNNTPASGFSQKNRNAWGGMEELEKARRDMAKLKREEAMKKKQESDKIKLHIFQDAFTDINNEDYGWDAGTSRKEQNQDMECDDDDYADYEKDDTDHKMAYRAKYDDRDRHFMKKGASDKLNLVLLSKKIWPGGEGCHVNMKRTISIQELEDVLKLKSFGVEVDHIDRYRLGPIYRFEMDSDKSISNYSIRDGDQVILL